MSEDSIKSIVEFRWRMPVSLGVFLERLVEELNTTTSQLVRDLISRLEHEDPKLLKLLPTFKELGEASEQNLRVGFRVNLKQVHFDTLQNAIETSGDRRRSGGSVLLNGYFQYLMENEAVFRHGYIDLSVKAKARR